MIDIKIMMEIGTILCCNRKPLKKNVGGFKKMIILRNGRIFFGKLPKCSHINIVDLPEWVLVSLRRFLLLLVAPADLVESTGFTLCASKRNLKQREKDVSQVP